VREGVVSKMGEHHLGNRTPVYHTRLDGWPPREMLWKRGNLLEVIQVRRRLGRALQLPLFRHVHPAIFQVGDIRFLTLGSQTSKFHVCVAGSWLCVVQCVSR